jgi:hypothetical protein
MSDHQAPLTGNPCDPDDRGELIGIGGQYTVHDIGHGRVMKIPNSIDGSRRFVGGWRPEVSQMTNRHMPLWETAFYRELCVPHVLRLTARYPALYEIMARPEAKPGLCFTQDKVQPIKESIVESEPNQIRRYLDATADIYQLLWRYGIHDYICFFWVNNAIDAEGKVVYLDFGETAFDTTRVSAHIKSDWVKKGVLIKNLSADLQDYYIQVMKDRLFGDNFEQHWATELDDVDRLVIKSPKLHERPEDITPLVEQILERANREEGWNIRGVSAAVGELFHSYQWTGIIDGVSEELAEKLRGYNYSGSGVELQNALYRAAAACQGTVIEIDDLPNYLQAHHRRLAG